MRRREFEKTLRAAGRIAGDSQFFVIGSQAIHASCSRPPAEVLLSQECDIYPKDRPQMSSVLHAELGRRSRFARLHGYYADIVTPEIANLPAGWQRRLRRVQVKSRAEPCSMRSIRHMKVTLD